MDVSEHDVSKTGETALPAASELADRDFPNMESSDSGLETAEVERWQESIPAIHHPVCSIFFLAAAAFVLVFAVLSLFGQTTVDSPAAVVPESEPLLRLDVNLADEREWALLPGVGPVLARRIVRDREQNGLFTSPAELKRVHGLGDKILQQIQRYCFVSKAEDVTFVSAP